MCGGRGSAQWGRPLEEKAWGGGASPAACLASGCRSCQGGGETQWAWPAVGCLVPKAAPGGLTLLIHPLAVLNAASQEELSVWDVRILPNFNASYLPMMPDGSVLLVDDVW